MQRVVMHTAAQTRITLGTWTYEGSDSLKTYQLSQSAGWAKQWEMDQAKMLLRAESRHSSGKATARFPPIREDRETRMRMRFEALTTVSSIARTRAPVANPPAYSTCHRSSKCLSMGRR